MIRLLRPLLAVLALLVSVFVNAQPTARFEDSMAQRLLACTGCHGLQGRAAPDGFYPRLAGKPAGYLYNQLRNFQDGRRHYALMVNLLEPLSDAYLREIAEHFSKLDIPYLAPLRTPVAARVLQRGRELATEGDTVRKIPACARCHGEALMGLVPFVPGLLGLPPDYLLAQLGAWRTGGRHARSPDCMAEVAKRLAPEDVSAVVGWLAAQRVPEAAKPTTALPRPMPMACGSTAISTLAESGVAP